MNTKQFAVKYGDKILNGALILVVIYVGYSLFISQNKANSPEQKALQEIASLYTTASGITTDVSVQKSIVDNANKKIQEDYAKLSKINELLGKYDLKYGK